MLEGPTNWSSFGVGLLEGPKRIPLLCVGAINRYLHGKRRGRFNRSHLVFAGSRQERKRDSIRRWAWPRHQGQQHSFDLSRPRWHARRRRRFVVFPRRVDSTQCLGVPPLTLTVVLRRCHPAPRYESTCHRSGFVCISFPRYG